MAPVQLGDLLYNAFVEELVQDLIWHDFWPSSMVRKQIARILLFANPFLLLLLVINPN